MINDIYFYSRREKRIHPGGYRVVLRIDSDADKLIRVDQLADLQLSRLRLLSCSCNLHTT